MDFDGRNFMEEIENIVMLSSKKYPWEFYDYIVDNLSEENKILFKQIWQIENDSKFWNYNSNLKLCRNNCANYLNQNFNLNNTVTKIIANMISYDWK